MPENELSHEEILARIGAAEVLGHLAFVGGKKRVPALDRDLKPLLAGIPVGMAGIAILDAWLRGWDNSNLCGDVQ